MTRQSFASSLMAAVIDFFCHPKFPRRLNTHKPKKETGISRLHIIIIIIIITSPQFANQQVVKGTTTKKKTSEDLFHHIILVLPVKLI
jgi:hypothetical protein